MSRKPIQYPEIVKELKEYIDSDDVKLTLTFQRKSLSETLYVNGTWNNKDYSITADICWRSGQLYTTDVDVEDLIKLLKKKNISEMTQKDFSSLELNETRDGDTTFYDLEWSEPLTEEEEEDAPSEWDMYNDGEISDAWYEFDGGIDTLTIEIEDYSRVITE
jgi:hypothetical protein